MSTLPAPRPRRRWTELGMLVVAGAVALTAWASLGYATGSTLPPDTAGYALGLAGLFVAAHLVVRWRAPYADPLLLPCAALLNALGLVLIHRLDLAPGVARAASPLQLVWSAVGVAAFVGVLLVVPDHRLLQRYGFTAAALGLLLLLIPAVLPASHSSVNGARIWIRFSGFSIEPSEVAKLCLEVFFAGYLVAKRDVFALVGRKVVGMSLPRARDLGPVLLAWLASLAVLVRENDIGTSLLFFGIFVAMLYVATGRRSWLAIGLVLFVGGALAAYRAVPHVRARVDVWLHPFAYAQTTGYQPLQGLFGLAAGGIAGTGLGRGHPYLVPFANSDFITSTIGEELGLAGLMAVVLVFGVMVERGLRAALASRDEFGALLAAGLSFGLALQVFIVVGGVTGLIPLTGMTLPFLSYGGSSLVANWALVALLLRISDRARRPAPAPVSADAPTQVVRR